MGGNIRKVSKERAELQVEWKRGDEAREGRSTSLKTIEDDMCDLLGQACNTIRQVAEGHKELPSVEKGRSDYLEVQVTNPTGYGGKSRSCFACLD